MQTFPRANISNQSLLLFLHNQLLPLKIDEGQIIAAERENFYRLLGAYRSVSEAIGDYVEKAEVIDWNYWREERFA